MKGKRRVKSKPRWGILTVTMILILSAVYVTNWKRTKIIDRCPRYTIAYCMNVKDKKVNYTYSISGKNFTGIWFQSPRSFKDYMQSGFVVSNFIGKRFLVRVNCNNPEINEIDWTHAIPENVNTAPSEGWLIIPKEFPVTEFAD